MNKAFQILIGFIVVALFLSTQASAQKLRGTIDSGTIRGIPTAIVPFKVVDGSVFEHDVAQVISDDLAASGKFEPIAPSRFLTKPSKADEVRFKDWRFVNAEVLVIGEIWKIGEDSFEIQFRMFDVAREQEIGSGKRIPNLRSADLRSAAHIISDQVYTAFTGQPGAFNSRIAYIERSEIEYQRFRYKLMVADWDGFGAQEVYGSWEPLISPSWSPDGKNLAFVSFSKKGPVVQTLELTTGKAEVIAAFKGVNSAPAWSPDGNRLAYSASRNGSPDVYVYNFVTQEHLRINSHYGIDTEPAWSPDGNSLLFTSSRAGKPQIYRFDFANNQQERISFEGNENANASYDYTGEKIALVHEGGKIAVMQEQTGQITLISNAEFDESPSFSPNGDMVLYAAENNYEPALMVASSDGRIKTRLEFITGDVREPAWSPLKK